MSIITDQIDIVRVESSDLGGIVVQLIDIDGRTIIFQRCRTRDEAVAYLRVLRIEMPVVLAA